jgi:hypothetical protein
MIILKEQVLKRLNKIISKKVSELPLELNNRALGKVDLLYIQVMYKTVGNTNYLSK